MVRARLRDVLLSFGKVAEEETRIGRVLRDKLPAIGDAVDHPFDGGTSEVRAGVVPVR
jgi:hypothetical protein